VRVILTPTRASANEAKRARQSGQSFDAVAKRFAIDRASRARRGRLIDVVEGKQDTALDSAVFAARKGTATGPVKTRFGYYVFEVERITPASQQPLRQARPTITQLLASQREQDALDDFVRKFARSGRSAPTDERALW
jgi:foldase protein PrsA